MGCPQRTQAPLRESHVPDAPQAAGGGCWTLDAADPNEAPPRSRSRAGPGDHATHAGSLPHRSSTACTACGRRAERRPLPQRTRFRAMRSNRARIPERPAAVLQSVSKHWKATPLSIKSIAATIPLLLMITFLPLGIPRPGSRRQPRSVKPSSSRAAIEQSDDFGGSHATGKESANGSGSPPG